MIRLAIILLLLFIASAASIMVGYYSLNLGLSTWWFKGVLRQVPVLRSAFAFTLLCPFTLLAAFWISQRSEGMYRNTVAGWSYIFPFLLGLFLLPGVQEGALFTPHNYYLQSVLLTVANISACLALRGWFWQRGNPPE